MTLHDLRHARILPLLLFGGMAPSASADVIINEFERAGGGSDRIEVYNTRADTTYDLTGWKLVNQDGVEIALSGMLGPLARKTAGAVSYVADGGEIELIDMALLTLDEVEWGSFGGAPTPPLVGAWSCARSPDGVDTDNHAYDWNLDPTGTLGAVNDGPGPALGGEVVFNEAGNSPFARGVPGGACQAPLIELFNPLAIPLSLDGYFISDGRTVDQIFGMTIPDNGWAVITDFNPAFCFQETNVLYLFNAQGKRIDQLGFTGAALPPSMPELTFQRVPDGAGPSDGYDWVTSGGSETLVIQEQTFGGTNGSGPVTSSPEPGELMSESFGATKIRYR